MLTEFPAIAFWLASSFPQAGLWPDDLDDRTRCLEALDFTVSTVHMRGFTFARRPEKFIADITAQDALRAHGRRQVDKGLDILSNMLGDRSFLLGTFGIADCGLYYVLEWATADGFPVPNNLQQYFDRLKDRPSVRRARG